MLVKLCFGPDTKFDPETGVVTIRPEFVTPQTVVRVATGLCETDDGQIIEKYELTVSGKSGKIVKREPCSGSAEVDLPKKPKPPDTSSTTEDPNGES